MLSMLSTVLETNGKIEISEGGTGMYRNEGDQVL